MFGELNSKNFIENIVYKDEDLVEKTSVEESPSNVAILGNKVHGKGDEIKLTDDFLKLINEENMMFR